MNGKRSLVAITLALSLAILPSAIAAEKSSSKAAGPSPTTVVNTILSGAGVPSKTLGINGDFYIDTKNLNLYGPKTKGVWKITTSLKSKDVPVVSNIIGESGAMGQTGPKGDKGVTGDKGATGATGIQGATGAIGVTGLAGAMGAAGTAGTPGLAGAKGDPGTQGIQGIQGIKGDAGTQGIQGVKGDAGSQGIQGVKGDTGLPGTSLSSISYLVSLGTWTLATIEKLGISDSSNFITLESGSYTFNISVDGTFVPEATVAMYIGMQVISSGGSMDYQVFASDSRSFINSTGERHYQFMIIGKIVCTGSTTLKLRAVDQFGVTGGNFLNFSGKALVNKVGSIG